MYCSAQCRDGTDAGSEPASEPAAPRRPAARGIVIASVAAFGLTAAWLAFDRGGGAAGEGPRYDAPKGPPRTAALERLPEHGPAWPPTEQEQIEALADGAWLHPLRGPTRRMPEHTGRVFGAPRPGDRPSECKAGHCGVDIGGSTEWGEPVLAIHHGVVERVERSPNANGGRYVWLRHRDHAVSSRYFHLAAIPPSLEAGDRVERGDTIGLLGGSGVEHSEPHLHFALAIDAPARAGVHYVDPEPLLAFWPLALPVACETETRLTTDSAPGQVIGSYGRGGERTRRVAEGGDGRAADAGGGGAEPQDGGGDESAAAEPEPTEGGVSVGTSDEPGEREAGSSDAGGEAWGLSPLDLDQD